MMGLRTAVLCFLAALGASLTVSALEEFYPPIASTNSIAQHTLKPPLLASFEENGLPYWSFGGATVITDSSVVLTPRAGMLHGYLWNQQPCGLHNWQARYIVRANVKPGFSLISPKPCQECGVAFWHLREPSRHEASHFFGVPDKFNGIGVILRHDGLFVVKNDGRPVHGLQSVQIATVSGTFLSAFAVEVIIRYSTDAHSLTVVLNRLDSATSFPVPIGVPLVQYGVDVDFRSYFGFTAQSSDKFERQFMLLDFEVESIAGETEVTAAANESALVDFDLALDLQDREYWMNRGDQPEERGGDANQNPIQPLADI